MENNTNLLGQLNISNYSIHIFSKYIHELIFDNVVYQNDHNLARYDKIRFYCPIKVPARCRVIYSDLYYKKHSNT